MDVSGVHFTVSTNYFFSFPLFLAFGGKVGRGPVMYLYKFYEGCRF